MKLGLRENSEEPKRHQTSLPITHFCMSAGSHSADSLTPSQMQKAWLWPARSLVCCSFNFFEGG